MMEQIKGIFNQYRPTPAEKEAQMEKDWVRPVLRTLGHADFAVQPSSKTPDGTKEPDYVFYHDRVARDSSRGETADEAQTGIICATWGGQLNGCE
jgi:hypothetical protein